MRADSTIKGKIEISALPLLLAWLLVLVLPITGSLLAIDYFLAEYELFAEPGQIEQARQKIDECRNLLVSENFLQSRLPELENLTKSENQRDLAELKRTIDESLHGKSLLCIFFDETGHHPIIHSFRPVDFKQRIPPAVLFRKQIDALSQCNYLSNPFSAQEKTPETLRNALQIQRMFKTITPVFLKPGKVSKSFSVAFGGELYFAHFEFKQAQAGQKGCIAIIRGRDLSWSRIYKTVRQKFPLFNLTVKQTDMHAAYQHPEKFFSGVRREKDQIIVTATADQSFVRSWLHHGGITIKQRENGLKIPFIEYRIPAADIQHSLHKMRSGLGIAAKTLIVVSLIQLIHILLFGLNLDISFKRRILASVMLVSIFPFTFLAIGFQLFQQYDDFLLRLNLIQYLELTIAQTNHGLTRFMEEMESSMRVLARKIDSKLIKNDDAINRFLEHAGKTLPVSAVAVHRPEDSLILDFPERLSPGGSSSAISFVEKFIPRQSMKLLLEPEPIVNRTRQDIVIVAGNVIKNASIAEGMRSNGKLYYVDQTESVIWYSTLKLYDEKDPSMPFIGLMGAKFETGPILSAYLASTTLAQNEYTDTYADYSIKYAFMPTEKAGLNKIWSGNGFINEPVIKKLAAQQRSQSLITTEENGISNYLISRVNHNIPHVAVAMARLDNKSKQQLPSIVALMAYLFLVFYLVSQLLERFFVLPVVQLAKSAEAIARGSDCWNLQLPTGDEFEKLNEDFSQMVVGLQQRNMLRDYISEDAASQIEAAESKDMAPGGEYLEATIIFAALRNYTELTTEFTPEQNVALLNQFISCGDRLVKKHHGTIDKIIDNTLMLVFRENEAQIESHALRAVRTALEMAAEMRQQNLDIYAGIASGTVISGRIGSYSGKLDFTVIGDQVNLAARLKTEAIDSTGGLIISGSTMRLLKGKGRVNFLRRCSLKGKSREYNIYELYELR